MTTYSISLDDVDLALLPLPTHKYNDFLKKQHFQFQVLKTDTLEETDSAPVILYTCHICAIEVPAAFAREHAASIKHRANARIASVAVQRTRALITALPPPAAAQTARFCANCATTVGRNHEKTKEHRVAAMHDKLLWELMTAYVGEDDNKSNYDSDSSSYSEFNDGVTKDNTHGCNAFGTWNKVNSIEDQQKICDMKVASTSNDNNKSNYDLDSSSYSESDIMHGCNAFAKKGKEAFETNKNEAKKEKFRNIEEQQINYDMIVASTSNDTARKEKATKLKTIGTDKKEHNENGAKEQNQNKDDKESKHIDNKVQMNEENTNNQDSRDRKSETTTYQEEIAISGKPKAAETIKMEYVDFVTKDNKQVKVFSDYYHSFTRKVDTINCIVCSCTFKNDEVDSHMFSLKHLNMMPSTLIDEQCVRQINDTYGHCILCNQIVKNCNVAKHCLTFGHGQREKQAVTANSSQATTSNIAVPNTNAAKANLDVKPKVAINGDVKATKAPENANSAAANIDWPVIYPYELTGQENSVRCVICDCNVPNNPDNRKGHLVGLNHAKNVKNKRNMGTES